MQVLNRRVGFLRRKSENEKIEYFFIHSSNVMYTDESWFRLRGVFRESFSIEEAEEKFQQSQDLRRIDLRHYLITSNVMLLSSQQQPLSWEDTHPFINRYFFELSLDVSNGTTSTAALSVPPPLMLFGISDEHDTQDLFAYVMSLETARSNTNNNLNNNQMDAAAASSQQSQQLQQQQINNNNQTNNSNSNSSSSGSDDKSKQFFEYIEAEYQAKLQRMTVTQSAQQEEEQQKQMKQVYLLDLISKLEKKKSNGTTEESQETKNTSNAAQNQQDEQLQESQQGQILQLSEQVTYSGQVREGFPHGEGMEIGTDGVQYKGSYRYGERHGPGQFVDSNLDMYSFEYIMGQPVGI